MDPELFSAEAPEPPPFVAAAPVRPLAVVVPGTLHLVLAGLESGVMGALIMVAWFALDSVLERQYWWAVLNLWGAGIYHNRVFTMGFGAATLAGAASMLFLHALGGVIWSLLGGRLINQWLHLSLSFAAACAWFLLLQFGFWPLAAPVVPRMNPMPATLLAYVLYAAALSRNAHRANQLAREWRR